MEQMYSGSLLIRNGHIFIGRVRCRQRKQFGYQSAGGNCDFPSKAGTDQNQYYDSVQVLAEIVLLKDWRGLKGMYCCIRRTWPLCVLD